MGRHRCDRWVVKTVDQAGRKVFINVCGSSRVSLPGTWTDGKARADLQQNHSRRRTFASTVAALWLLYASDVRRGIQELRWMLSSDRRILSVLR